MERALTERAIGAEVQRFLAEHVDAPEQLDILLLLYRHPDRDFNAVEVGHAVYTVPAAARSRLERLTERGLASSDLDPTDPRFRYRPATDELAAGVAALADVYSRDRAALIKLVLARTTDPAQQFADAFRLRGDKR